MIAYSILFFFFFRLITDFVEAVYAFGLLGVGLPPEMALVLLWFSPLVLLLFNKGFSSKTLVILAEIVILTGAIDAMLDTRLRMFVSGVGNAVFFVLLPSLLVHFSQKEKREEISHLTVGLALGLLGSILLRAWVSGINPSGTNFGQLLGLVLGAAGALLFVRIPHADPQPEQEPHEPASPAPFWQTAFLYTGLIACLLMLYFTLESPHVAARWADLDLLTVMVITVLGLVLFAGLLLFLSRRKIGLPAWVPLAWNGLFVLVTAAALLPRQERFPSAPDGYPLFEMAVSPVWDAAIYLMLLLSPVILLDFWLILEMIMDSRPTLRRMGGAAALASLFLLVMVIAQIGTTVYDYLPVIGPLMRDRYWLVFTLLAAAAGLPVLLIRGRKTPIPSGNMLFSNLAAVLATLSIAGVMVISAVPAQPESPTGPVRVITYNIQQAYSAEGQKSHVELVDLMHQLQPDILGLEETDSARIAGGNSDLVRYFSDHLGYYTYPGPGVVPGTFGIALFSRYPIENPQTFYMYSEGEQTAAILAEIPIDGTTYTVLVTHLGNHGPIVQQQAVLQALTGKENILAMGDYNFRPDTEQYHLTTETLADSWVLLWPGGDEVPGFDPTHRIDYIFVSPGMNVTDAEFLTGPESDHPGYMIEIGE